MVLDDGPGLGAAGVVPPEREAEPGPLLHRGPVRSLEGERVGAGLDREVAVHAHGDRGVLHHPQLGEASKVVLASQRYTIDTNTNEI